MEGFHAVVPRTDCPHALPDQCQGLLNISITRAKEIMENTCGHCDETYENWICLLCGAFECSRYKNGHMKDHNEATGHGFALSMVEFSCWCYNCNDYIEAPTVKRIHDTIYLAKFNEPPQHYSDDPTVLSAKVSELSSLVKGSRKITFFVGNGINMSAISVDENRPVESENQDSLFAVPSSRALPLKKMEPTVSHKALTAICALPGTTHQIVTTNWDDMLTQCGHPSQSLIQTKIRPGESVNPEILQQIAEKSAASDLYVVIGSSMRTSPANQIPDLVKKNGGKLVIVNVQNTDFDSDSSIRIWASIDSVMEKLCDSLELTIE